ncbi:MAG: family 10 glycosylhydrolase [Pirellulales bacterium]|nr:family 10 glycosylhydrolase [Pirellulales bacterium]
MRRRECLLLVPAVVAAIGFAPGAAWCADKPVDPFMGAWINVSGLVGPGADVSARERSIAENLDQFKASGLRAIILFATTTSGRAEYPSEFIPDKIWADWDPVDVIVREARKRGLQVWPSMCVMACGSNEPRGILKQHPEWALRDKAGNPMGFLSAGNPEVHKYVTSVLREIATKYQPDGIMLDYCRYPGDEAAMDPVSQARFDAAHPADQFPINSAERKEAFRKFKADCLTELVDEFSSALHALKPAPRIGCYMWGVHELKGTRDWKTWAEHGDIDLFNLTGYYYEKNRGKDYLKKYEDSFRSMAAVLKDVGRPIDFTVCVGIVTSHGRIQKADEIDAYLEIAKRAGVNGAAIFTWHTLKPYLPEVNRRKYFSKFEAGLKPAAR